MLKRSQWRGAVLAVSALLLCTALNDPGLAGPARAGAPARPHQDPTPTPAPAANVTPPAAGTDTAGVKVKLHYMREATKIVALLKAIQTDKSTGADLQNLVIHNVTEDEIILYGPKERRNYARRVIATLDLPRPGVEMEMWGVQVSSPKPEKMGEVMLRVREVINQTQRDVRDTYEALQQAARRSVPDGRLNEPFRKVLEDELFYYSALDADRPLSLTDILLRMIAADDPSSAAEAMARELAQLGKRINDGHRAWLDAHHAGDLARLLPQRPPFERFLRARGLTLRNGAWSARDDEGRDNVVGGAAVGRRGVLDFALHYGRLVHEPQRFDAYQLQQSADVLNSRLQSAVEALNLDLQDLFVTPTLIKIQKIVREFKDVDYAQAGKTGVSSLSGAQTQVTSGSVSAIDVTPPLGLGELLTEADSLSQNVAKFVPNPADNLVGAMPLSKFIGLLGAFGKDRTQWRELKAGVSLTLTPNVLRNMTSAELQVDLTTGDPQGGSREQGVRPLSRVSQHNVKTSVYVDALDFFDLSAFNSQSTIDGGRGYVPIVGTVWRGIFSDVPVVGKLLSWKKSAKTVYHESLVLTTAFITPTAMGVAVLYPTELTDRETNKPREYNFGQQWVTVERYKAMYLSGK